MVSLHCCLLSTNSTSSSICCFVSCSSSPLVPSRAAVHGPVTCTVSISLPQVVHIYRSRFSTSVVNGYAKRNEKKILVVHTLSIVPLHLSTETNQRKGRRTTPSKPCPPSGSRTAIGWYGRKSNKLSYT